MTPSLSQEWLLFESGEVSVVRIRAYRTFMRYLKATEDVVLAGGISCGMWGVVSIFAFFTRGLSGQAPFHYCSKNTRTCWSETLLLISTFRRAIEDLILTCCDCCFGGWSPEVCRWVFLVLTSILPHQYAITIDTWHTEAVYLRISIQWATKHQILTVVGEVILRRVLTPWDRIISRIECSEVSRWWSRPTDLRRDQSYHSRTFVSIGVLDGPTISSEF